MRSAKAIPLLKTASLLGAFALPAPVQAADWAFMDDRSSPQKLVESFYFAISNRYYTQAYSYFSAGSAPESFDAWQQGYADTEAVEVKFGETAPDPGAGQIFWSLPVALSASMSDGTTDVYAGCYRIHMTNVGMQSDPPFQPMGIVSAKLRRVNVAFNKATPGPC